MLAQAATPARDWTDDFRTFGVVSVGAGRDCGSRTSLRGAGVGVELFRATSVSPRRRSGWPRTKARTIRTNQFALRRVARAGRIWTNPTNSGRGCRIA